MRVIFLDFDGVLNSDEYALKLEDRHHALGHTRETTCDCFKLYHQIDREAVARLNRLVAATEAKIVISSSWRKLFDPPELHRILGEHGLVAEIIGETPDGVHDLEVQETYGQGARIYRGHEIDLWLKKHPEVEQFVILDDGSDMAMHKKRLVQTDSEEGLLDDHVKLAIRVLSWDGKTLPAPCDEAEKDLIVAIRKRHALSPSRNSYRWDEIGNYIVSTVRLPEPLAGALGARYETLVYSSIDEQWDFDRSGARSVTAEEADHEHAVACARVTGKVQ